MSAKTVFISYSHDSPAHSQRVLELADALRNQGVDAEVDQYEVRPSQGWPKWCEQQLHPENSKFVLMICTDIYRQRIEDKVPADEGRGVFWEGRIISNYLYNERENKRFIPILLDDATVNSIPQPLPADTRYLLKAFDLNDPGYRALYRELTAQPAVIKPPKGAVVALPPDAKSAVKPLNPLPVREALSDFTPTGTSSIAQESASPDTKVGSSQSEGASEVSPEDKPPGESDPQPPGVSWGSMIGTSLTILVFAVIALGWAYGAVFGPKISMVVQDLDWEPQSPKPGQTVKFTAKFASTYTVRQFAGAYWPRTREVEGKRSAFTFTETWSIAGAEFKKDRVEVLESGHVTTSQTENVFNKPGSYRVAFSLNVQRDDHRNEITRTIWVGDN
jgi:hypothetical protein